MTGPIQWNITPDWQGKMMPGVTKFLNDVGSEILADMADLVPEGTRDHAGPHLKDTLYARVAQNRNARGQFGRAELEVGATADYALDVEFGHMAVDGSTFVEAQPFIRPAVYKHRDNVHTEIAPGGGSDFEGNPPLAES